jgi:hypothetical protein
MATTKLDSTPMDGVYVVTWGNLGAGETGDASDSLCRYTEKTIQASGAFVTVDIQGSNDGSNWFAAHKMDGTAMQFTTPGILKMLESPRYIRPVVAGGAAVVIALGVQVSN